MEFGETLAQLRRNKNLSQAQLAAQLYVTRQAVSRWENGETTPNIDMLKLIAIALDVPVQQLLSLPNEPACQCCGTPFSVPNMPFGTNADGSENTDYCKWCYDQGTFAYDDMDALIEFNAPYVCEATGMTPDQAVSFLGIVLPTLKRWQTVQENERKYGAEARALFGDDAVDAANQQLLTMDEEAWNSKEALGELILEKLRRALPANTPSSEEGQEIAALHEQWIRLNWGKNQYSREAHAGLARMYLEDERFRQFYDTRAGAGATRYLATALLNHCGE